MADAPIPDRNSSAWRLNKRLTVRRTTVQRGSIASPAGRPHSLPLQSSRSGAQLSTLQSGKPTDFIKNTVDKFLDAVDGDGDDSPKESKKAENGKQSLGLFSRTRVGAQSALGGGEKQNASRPARKTQVMKRKDMSGALQSSGDATRSMGFQSLSKTGAAGKDQLTESDPLWLKHKKNLEGIMFKAERASIANAAQLRRPTSSPGLRSFVNQFLSLGHGQTDSNQQVDDNASTHRSLEGQYPLHDAKPVVHQSTASSGLRAALGLDSGPSAAHGKTAMKKVLSVNTAARAMKGAHINTENLEDHDVETARPKRTFTAEHHAPTHRATTYGLPREVQQTSRRRPSSAPGGGGVEVTVRSLVPDLQLAGIGDGFDEQRRHTQMPMLPEGKLMLLLKQRDFKSVFRSLREHFMTEWGESLEAADAMASAEKILLGSIRSDNTRQILLLWIMGGCLEGLGQEQAAIRFFGRCTALDRLNPIHPYNRGVCWLKLGNRDAAHVDFCLAIDLCLQREQAPPLEFNICRALGGAAIPREQRHVWADFELARHRIQNPGQVFSSISRKIERAGGFSQYHDDIVKPMPLATDHLNPLTSIITQAAERDEEFTPSEQKAVLRFLRRTPEMALIPKEVLCRNMHFFTVHRVTEDQPMLPTNNWHCIMEGKLGIFRFTPINDAYCNQGSAQAASMDTDTGDWLQLPPALWTKQNWERVDTMDTLSYFNGGDVFGPQGDAWLVADETTEILAFPLVCIERMKRKIDSSQTDGFQRDVDFLSGVELFRNLPMRLMCSMLEEFIERHEAICGEDPLGTWPGLLIVKKGQLQLTLKQEQEHFERRKALKPGPIAIDRSAWLGAKVKKQVNDQPKVICVLEPGDCVGDETLLGGTGFSFCCSSEVVSVSSEFWVLPQAKQDAADKMGLLEFLANQREANLQAIERKIDEMEYWNRTKKKTLEKIRGRTGTTVEEVRTPIDPMPKPCGGMLLSWVDRKSPGDP